MGRFFGSSRRFFCSYIVGRLPRSVSSAIRSGLDGASVSSCSTTQERISIQPTWWTQLDVPLEFHRLKSNKWKETSVKSQKYGNDQCLFWS